MKKLLFISILTLAIFDSWGQKSINEPVADEAPQLITKFSLSELAGRYSSVGIGIEHPIVNFHLMHEIAYTYGIEPDVSGFDYNVDEFDKVSGFKIKEEIRIYDRHSGKTNHSGVYFGIGTYYNIVSHEAIYAQGQNCINGNCEYYEWKTGKPRRRRIQLLGIIGVQDITYRPFVMDFSMGIGIQRIKDSFGSIDDIENISPTKELPGPRYAPFNNNQPMMTLNIRIGMILK